MKHIYSSCKVVVSLILATLAPLFITAQVITTDPPFPTDQDQVTITYDATQGNAGLLDATPPIYAHTGVITDKSSSSTDWKYVVADWNVNTDKCQLTPLGNNLYQLVIGPSVREFYGVPASDTIKKLAFVFRNSDGSKTGRMADQSDIFTDIYKIELSINMIKPESGTIADAGSSVYYKTLTNLATLTELYVDDVLKASTSDSILEGNVTVETVGLHWFKFMATDGVDYVSDSAWVYSKGNVPVADLPSGVRPGINYIDDQTATLVLSDPPALKSFVYLLGDFNDWTPSEAYQMNRTPDGKYYWFTLDNLTPGTEYAYQYWIDGEIKIADPYCQKILDPWNDQYISSTIYPDLKPYPTGKTTGIVSVLQTAQPAYQWEVGNFDTPSPDNLVIYEMLIRDFVETRDIKTIGDTLAYLQRLGITAIELMPINEFEGNDSWGYNPSFYFAPDKAYGRINDYKAFIDECHKRGMAVIIDMVLNHSYGQSPLVQMYFDQSAGSSGQPSATNPWYNQVCPHEPYCWGYDFNHQSVYTQAFVDSVTHYWIEEFKVDGFRFDFTKGFTNVSGDGWNYDASRISILKRMYNKIKAAKPDALVILEHLTVNSEEKELSAAGMLLWGNMNGAYAEASMGWLPNSDITAVAYNASSRGWSAPHLVGYMESHDEERCMYKNITYGNSYSAYNVKDLTTAIRRQELTGALFFTVPGPKMIWQFGELGYDVSIDDPCRLCAKPLHWEYQDDWRRAYLYNVWSSLIGLKKNYEAFSTTDFALNGTGAYKTLHLNHSTMNVLVAGNFDVKATNSKPEFQHTGWWYNYFAGDSLQVSDTAMYLPLQAGEYRLYTDKKLEKPAIGTGISGNNDHNFAMNIFPNPANTGLTIDFFSDRAGESVVRIFDINGREASRAIVVNNVVGLNTLPVNISQLRPGIYLVQVQNGISTSSRRLVIR